MNSRIELSITPAYCPTWGLWEGIREIAQNWLDQRDRPLEDDEVTPRAVTDTVKYAEETHVLQFTNLNAEVTPADIALLGETDKADTGERGHWGEGVKLACLALFRAGHGVAIHSGTALYRTAIRHSEAFDTDVLMFDRSSDASYLNGVCVSIFNVAPEDWEQARHRLIPLRAMAPTVHEATSGQVLLDDPDRGDIFHKGIFVTHDDKLPRGYNFTTNQIKLDRDRSMVRGFDLQWHASAMESDLLKADVTTGEDMLERLEAGGTEVAHADNFLGEGRAKVEQAFEDKYGKDHIPGPTDAGLKGVTVPYALREVLSSYRAKKVTAAAEEPVECHGEVDPGHQEVLTSVTYLLKDAGHPVDVHLVSFADPNAKSAFRDGKVLVSISTLSSQREFLKAVVSAIQVDDADVYTDIIAQQKGWK
jgi:hypothetical protein